MAHVYGEPGTKRGKNPLKVWREYVGTETPVLGIDIPEGQEGKHVEYVDAAALGEDMIGRYLDHWKIADEKISMILVEKPFEVLIPGPDGQPIVMFCGTYDGVYRDLETGHIYLFEHKTAKAISTNHLTLDDQASGYLMVAAQELRASKAISKSDQVRGVTYNFARKAFADERPRNEDGLYLNKDGSISKQQPAAYFLRHSVIRTVHERNTQLGHISAEALTMAAFDSGELPLYKNPTRDCSWDCPFYQMCVLHEAGGNDWQDLRDATFKVRDPYADHRPNAAGED
jgi:hypothetical protein